MKLVLLSGGSGKRLWPLSNDARSKQFLKVLTDEEGNKESMVQRVWGQLEKNNLAKDSLIATSKSQVEMIQIQVGTQVPIVVEPTRRDTFPAIALAAVYLYSVKGCSPHEVIAILPVDPYVENHFFSKVKELEKTLTESNAELALIGVQPTYPSEKYGYMVPFDEEEGNYMRVSSFKEKPRREEAERLIEGGGLWNSGVFAFRIEYLLNILLERGYPIQYEQLVSQYHLLPQNSFDYEVVEKAEQVIALSYTGYWKDLGTWNTLTEEMQNPISGKGFVSKGITNSHIVNELDIPITLIGLDDVVVAASPDGILVTNKEDSLQVKEILKDLIERPMFEERRWGWYKVLEHTKYLEGNEVLTKRICIETGKNLSYQVHYKRSEVWTVIKGEGVMVLDDHLQHIRLGDVIHIPLGKKHAVRATSTMEIIEVQTGSELIEEDIYRFGFEWEKIVNEIMLKNNVVNL